MVRTLGEASERAGFRVHAYVLMSNHYHLLLETKEANLSQGMGWLQNAFTRRINTRHKLWGHVFGGRYKAIFVEPGNCFWALLDYIHLNPVRACLLQEGDGRISCGLEESRPGGSCCEWEPLVRKISGDPKHGEFAESQEGSVKGSVMIYWPPHDP